MVARERIVEIQSACRSRNVTRTRVLDDLNAYVREYNLFSTFTLCAIESI